MKLVNSKYNLDIEFEENISNTLVLENKQHMIDVIQNLILQLKGDEGDFVLSSEKNVKFDKVVEFITNPFEIDFISKRIQLFLYLLISPRIADISLFFKDCRLFAFLKATAELGLNPAYLRSHSLYISL